MTNTLLEVMDDFGNDLLENIEEPDGLLRTYLEAIPDSISAQEVQEAAEDYRKTTQVMMDLGVADQEAALEGAFMHGFFMALRWQAGRED